MRRARSLATKQMAAEKSQDPEFRLEAFRQRMKKKGLLEEEEE